VPVHESLAATSRSCYTPSRQASKIPPTYADRQASRLTQRLSQVRAGAVREPPLLRYRSE